MTRTTIALAATVLAATTMASIPAAEAGFGIRLGFGGLSFGGFRGHHHHGHHHYRHRHVYIPQSSSRSDDSETKTYSRSRSRSSRKVIKEAAKPKPRKLVPSIQYADALGRQYDPVSKVWFDGQSQCWTGTQPFMLKNGTWMYGSSRWYPLGATWRSDTTAQPMAVDCSSVALFASRVKVAAAPAPIATPVAPVQPKVMPPPAPAPDKFAANTPATATTVTKAPEQKASKPADCRRYDPSLDAMVSVPCTE